MAARRLFVCFEIMDTDSAATLVCSARSCRSAATWVLLWRNPRIHSADRTKRWLACDEHRESLADFLARRDFPVRVEPLDPTERG